jgi:Na+-transporting NADH:ubiquinone oxidoreductase subunit NqrE
MTSGVTFRWRAIAIGAATGLAVIIPISVLVEVLERNVDDLEGSSWLFVPFLAVLAAYLLAGRVAAQHAPDAPMAHAALAGLGAFAGWLLVRVVVPLVQGNDLGFGARAIVTNALFAVTFGVLGAVIGRRNAPVSAD